MKHGVYLPKERYDSMEQTLKEQRDALDEMEAQLQSKTQDLEKLDALFEEKVHIFIFIQVTNIYLFEKELQLRESINLHNKTKQELSETSTKLEQTVVNLEVNNNPSFFFSKALPVEHPSLP